MFVKRNNSYLAKKLFKHLFINPTNVLFYVKNLILHYDKTPKEIRLFQCFMCKDNYVYPYKSKDYVACNKCWKTLKEPDAFYDWFKG